MITMVDHHQVDAHSWAEIDLAAVQHNFRRARHYAPDSQLCAVIKANAYGHGVEQIARALSHEFRGGDCFAVATLAEARRVYQALGLRDILILRGPVNAAELTEILATGFMWVLHSPWQADLLKQELAFSEDTLAPRMQFQPLRIWVKTNTGMNRLGMSAQAFADIWPWLKSLPQQTSLTLMSHFATADEPALPLAASQLRNFEALADTVALDRECDGMSLSASAGILAWPQAHFSMCRPGIMLYGASPMVGEHGPAFGLLPVMSLKSRLVTINEVRAGDTVGYGATYHCQQDMRIGVIGIGYGDGYPRHAPSGTPVLIHAGGRVFEAPLAGRVSMDMLTVDLTGIPAAPGDEVLLWGQGWGQQLPAERIADLCQTIAYELFCQITSRVKFIYQ
ncbi:MAG: alanine racemase [Pseudohongiella sp.]|uniref:alanine racemase n=1 Tax=Pseudohongiella sp. TaxID=1979412 RepID=UPI0034A0378D